MNTDVYEVGTVLNEKSRFLVPLYQRKYQWDDQRLEPFWDDVRVQVDHYLQGDTKNKHYMGALIVYDITPKPATARTLLLNVVDGQQRLTTFQIFLASLREVARNYDCESIMDQIVSYVRNELQAKDSDNLTKYKLTPSPPDKQIFQDFVDLPYKQISEKYFRYWYQNRVPKNCPIRSLRAYYFFYKGLDDYVKDRLKNGTESPSDEGDSFDSGQVSKVLEAILTMFLSNLYLVYITLDEEDDAQAIFESLNSKGQALTAMDLVRNDIFRRVERENGQDAVQHYYEQIWSSFEDAWWGTKAPYSNPPRPRIDHFLAHVLRAETGREIQVRNLYADYREFATPRKSSRFEHVEDELTLLQRYAPMYEILEGRGGTPEEEPSLHWLGKKLRAWKVTTAYPIAMKIGLADMDEEEKYRLANLIYSYIVRRDICGLPTKSLNKVFQSVTTHLNNRGTNIQALRESLKEKEGSLRFPRDEDFRKNILIRDVYNMNREKVLDILFELELTHRNQLTEEIVQSKTLTIERVLPESWTNKWPFPDGKCLNISSSEEEVLRRKNLIPTLGNLTLLTSRLNAAAGNRGFVEKRKQYKEHSILSMNEWFDKKEKWTEDEIKERGSMLADLAIDTWMDLDSDAVM